MAMEYYSFERVLKELQMEEDELKRLVSEGEIRAFRDEDKMKFRKSDIDGLKKGRMTEPTIILPSGEPDDPSEDSEVLLVEEDTSETLLDIEDNLEGSDSGSTAVPTVDLSASELDESSTSSSSSSSSSSSETITEELTFEEDSGSYVLDSSDDVLIDSSEELPSVDSKSDGDSYIDSDTGLQTEPLDLDGSEAMDKEDQTQPIPEQEDLALMPLDEKPRRARKTRVVYEQPMSAGMMFCMVAATVLLLFSGVFVINSIQEIDTPATGWFTDILYENAAPAKHLYVKGQISDAKLKSQMAARANWRKASK
ncbi:MAG: hypothetical protein HUU50_07810 [Candidatus Brocadiae bacterium]|nr:hypothetical protein [Candidatus Brocadiia bacterium]